jgi:hypothetical protein
MNRLPRGISRRQVGADADERQWIYTNNRSNTLGLAREGLFHSLTQLSKYREVL